MEYKINYCVNCEEEVGFIRGQCTQCKGKYDDVVPASYRVDLPWYKKAEDDFRKKWEKEREAQAFPLLFKRKKP